MFWDWSKKLLFGTMHFSFAAFSVTQCLTCLPYLYGLISNRPRLIQPYVTSLYPTMAVEGFVGVAKADSTILMYSKVFISTVNFLEYGHMCT
ncbi:hypothetical protein ONE63_001658 [Megalurothrips usitatus]|uniref:Uncharacterized protein n=1 Tax=Megalurothrips usitatus TaxID=439358 RepID=A0AAV7X913_9NEOP|nr:hypothetical protein ONE63_001658 [Megalurothrips usitatus]